eukprot:ANDGO_04944.mRNA.1 Phospholipase B-like protein B
MHSSVAAAAMCAICCLLVVAALDASVYTDASGKVTHIRTDVLDKDTSTAYGSFEDSLEESGWMYLNVTTNSQFADPIQAYAAGYLEGYVSAERISQYYLNVLELIFGENATGVPQPVLEFFSQQLSYVENQYDKHPNDPYWVLAYATHQTFIGIVDGYNMFAKSFGKLPVRLAEELQIVNSLGDLSTIMSVVLPSQFRPDWSSMDREAVLARLFTSSHCSAIVAVTPDFSQMLAGHTTWFTYSAMMRIWKTMEFNFMNPLVKSRVMQFSSYPGTVSSNDDYLQMADTKMVVLETSNDIFNNSLYDLVTANALLSWQRVQVASRGAASGPEWLELFARENSGTYVNQYMVVDFKLFAPSQPLPDNTLTVVEFIPGKTRGVDATPLLRAGHFPSYNVPFIQEIYEASGYPAMAKKYGPVLTWDLAPRAAIFRRDAHNVVDADSIGRFLQYNEWQTDPLSNQNPEHAISARGDLNPNAQRRSDGGGIDTKFTSSEWIGAGKARIRSGPTTDSQSVFDWEQYEQTTGTTYPRRGLPLRYDFNWVDVSA